MSRVIHIPLSLYSFLDWLSEEAQADGVREATSADESNDESRNFFLWRREEASVIRYDFRFLVTFPEQVDKFCYDNSCTTENNL